MNSRLIEYIVAIPETKIIMNKFADTIWYGALQIIRKVISVYRRWLRLQNELLHGGWGKALLGTPERRVGGISIGHFTILGIILGFVVIIYGIGMEF